MIDEYNRNNPPNLPYDKHAMYMLVHSMFIIVGNSDYMTDVLQKKLRSIEKELTNSLVSQDVTIYRTPCKHNVYELGIFICGVN